MRNEAYSKRYSETSTTRRVPQQSSGWMWVTACSQASRKRRGERPLSFLKVNFPVDRISDPRHKIEFSAARWHKLFYRLLDSIGDNGMTGAEKGEDNNHLARRMKEIEQDMFHEKFKQMVKGEWQGTEEQHMEADKKIANAIRNSLKNYENNPSSAGFDGPFFKF